MADQSRRLVEQLMSKHQLDCDYQASGKLVIHDTKESLAQAARQVALQRAAGGSEQFLLGSSETLALEPALKNRSHALCGSVWTPTDAVVNTKQLCKALVDLFTAGGGRLMTQCTVTEIAVANGRVGLLKTTAGDLTADAFILACGNEVNRLCRSVGLSFPLEPIKGYSITCPVVSSAPVVSITDTAKKVVFARLGNSLRVAGMAELVGFNTHIDTQRIQQLIAATRDNFGECCNFEKTNPWAGLRPTTPSGLPIVGSTKINGLFVNIGHGSLGLTLSFATAAQLAQVVMHAAP
jgi:D-amino-acid dehydrogenase